MKKRKMDKMRYEDTEEEYQRRLLIIPKKFRGIKCDKLDKVKQGTEQSMFITGSVGRGKTVLMANIAKEVLRTKERTVLWISYPGFIMKLQSSFLMANIAKEVLRTKERTVKRDESITPFDIAEEIASFPGTLCIDDIGAEKMTEFVQQITYYIINYREQEVLHTVITSNFSLRQIAEQIDTRVSSRISGMCEMVNLTGGDRRVEGKIKEKQKFKSDVEKEQKRQFETEREEEEFEPGSYVNFREEWKKKK